MCRRYVVTHRAASALTIRLTLAQGCIYCIYTSAHVLIRACTARDAERGGGGAAAALLAEPGQRHVSGGPVRHLRQIQLLCGHGGWLQHSRRCAPILLTEGHRPRRHAHAVCRHCRGVSETGNRLVKQRQGPNLILAIIAAYGPKCCAAQEQEADHVGHQPAVGLLSWPWRTCLRVSFLVATCLLGPCGPCNRFVTHRRGSCRTNTGVESSALQGCERECGVGHCCSQHNAGGAPRAGRALDKCESDQCLCNLPWKATLV